MNEASGPFVVLKRGADTYMVRVNQIEHVFHRNREKRVFLRMVGAEYPMHVTDSLDDIVAAISRTIQVERATEVSDA